MHHFTSITSTNSTRSLSQLDDFDQLHLENVFECQLENVYELYAFLQSWLATRLFGERVLIIPRKFRRNVNCDLDHFTSITSTNSTRIPSQLDDFDQLHLENVFVASSKMSTTCTSFSNPGWLLFGQRALIPRKFRGNVITQINHL